MPLTFNQEFALGASNQPDYTKLDSLNVSPIYRDLDGAMPLLSSGGPPR